MTPIDVVNYGEAMTVRVPIPSYEVDTVSLSVLLLDRGVFLASGRHQWRLVPAWFAPSLSCSDVQLPLPGAEPVFSSGSRLFPAPWAA